MNIFRRKKLTFNDSGAFKVVPFTMLDEQRVTLPSSFGEIFESHPAVHAVVGVIARSLSQTGLKAFMSTPDGPRPLAPGDRLNQLLRQPQNFKFQLARDVCVWGESLWLMVGERYPQELVRLSPEDVEVVGQGSLISTYKVGPDEFRPEDVLHIKIPSVLDGGLRGVSPLKSLRGILSEDIAANAHRLATWSGSQPGSVILRGLDAPEWSDTARERFAEAIKGKRAGDTLILEEGMQVADSGTGSAKDSEFLAGRRYVLEMVSSIYGVPQSIMAATSSDRNASEGRRNLIQDAIAPIASLIEDGINSQLVPQMFGSQAANGRIYTEFSIEAKLRGSFREQSQVFQMATGGEPWLTPDEVREMLNMPPLGDPVHEAWVKLRDAQSDAE